MTYYESLLQTLRVSPKVWSITGVAGFIGSNLLESLLKLDQTVVGLDNFASGYQHNLDDVRDQVSEEQWSRFRWFEGDIRNPEDCARVCESADYVLHHSAVGSVPSSIDDPVTANDINITGFLNMLVAARDAEVEKFVYASSSATYGDNSDLPQMEQNIGKPLSPYAVTKYVNELYAGVFDRTYGLNTIGLRYFNVYGKRQDPDGAYAAVIPKWLAAMIRGDDVSINGDGETTRDFCHVLDVVQMNILVATQPVQRRLENPVFNVAVGEGTTLLDLYGAMRDALSGFDVEFCRSAQMLPFRPGDIRHSIADISRARNVFQYEPHYRISSGIEEVVAWYMAGAE